MIKAIPRLETIQNWNSVKIEECGERLIPLKNMEKNRIYFYPQYYIRKIPGALKECYTRESVAYMLIKAAEKLPYGYKLIVWDAWRPIEVQQSLFNDYYDLLKRERTELNNEEITSLAKNFVSLPSTNALAPSPHNTGGSVDISIMDNHDKYLPMGTEFDAFDEKSNTRYFENLLDNGHVLTSEECIFNDNRRLLYNIMCEAGFSNYSHEWWHYDYGNQFWGASVGKNAIYGAASI